MSTLQNRNSRLCRFDIPSMLFRLFKYDSYWAETWHFSNPTHIKAIYGTTPFLLFLLFAPIIYTVPFLIILAGLPATRQWSGMSFVTICVVTRTFPLRITNVSSFVGCLCIGTSVPGSTAFRNRWHLSSND